MMLAAYLSLALSFAPFYAAALAPGTFASPPANSTLSFAGQAFHLIYYGAAGGGAISTNAQVTLSAPALGSAGTGLTAPGAIGYTTSKPTNLATLLPNAFQPGTSQEDIDAFNYNAYDYVLALPAQELTADTPGTLTVLEGYTVPNQVNGLSWTNRGSLPLLFVKS